MVILRHNKDCFNSRNSLKSLASWLSLFALLITVINTLSFSEEQLFTPEEQAWLNAHPLITVAPDIDYAPVEFEENGELKGIAMDYLDWFEKHYNIRFKRVHYDTWAQVIEAVKTQKVDMVSGAAKTPERMAFLHFTQPYIDTPTVIVRRRDSDPIPNEDTFTKLHIASIEGYAVNEFLTLRYPTLKIHNVTNIEEGLLKVSNGELEAMAAEAFQASYYVSRLKLSNLMIEPNYQIDFPMSLSMAARSDAPELVSIIDKMIASMPKAERQAIEQKWIGVGNYSAVPKSYLIVGGSLLAILFLATASVLLWNLTLKSRVREKTKELNDLNMKLEAKVERRTQLLSETNHQLELSMVTLQLKENELENMNTELEAALADLQTSQKRLVEVEKIAALGQLVATVAHEINTPLGNCIMSNDFLYVKSKYMKTELCEHQKLDDALCDYFETLESGHAILEGSLNHLKVIVDRFKALAVTNISASETEIDLIELLESCLTQQKILHPFEWEIQGEGSFKVIGIRMAYEEIFSNLISNSIVHGFSPEISHPEIIVKLEKLPNCLLIDFKDNGRGVDEALLEKVLEPLFTTNRVGGSGGIGLNVILNLLSHPMKGVLQIENLRAGGFGVTIKLSEIQWL